MTSNCSIIDLISNSQLNHKIILNILKRCSHEQSIPAISQWNS